MPTQSKTVILPIHPETNPGKIKSLTKITKRCTFAVSLFLDYAKANQHYDSKTLETHRKSIEKRTGLSSGFVQASREKAKTILKPYPDRLKSWQDKLTKLRKQLALLEKRKLKYEIKLSKARKPSGKTYQLNQQTLKNTHSKIKIINQQIESISNRPPRHPEIKVRQPIWFDKRIGSLEKSKNGSKFLYWITVSTLTKRERLSVPLLVSKHATKLLEKPQWQIKSFSIVWDSKKKMFSVNVRIQRHYRITELSNIFYGNDLGIKRPVCTSANDLSQVFVFDKINSATLILYKQLKALNNRVARLQRLGKIDVLKKLRGKQKRISKQLQHLIAKEIKEFLPDKPSLVAIGLPKYIRQHEGVRMKNSTTYRWTQSKQHRKRLNRWSFLALAEIIRSTCQDAGHLVVIVNEAWTSKTCHKCEGREVKINDRAFKCLNRLCLWTGDRDVNAAINIARIGMSKIAYSLEYKTYYILKEWQDLKYLPPLTELDHKNNGTEIAPYTKGVVDDVGSRSDASLNNQKTPLIDVINLIDQIKEKDQVAIPVKVEI